MWAPIRGSRTRSVDLRTSSRRYERPTNPGGVMNGREPPAAAALGVTRRRPNIDARRTTARERGILATKATESQDEVRHFSRAANDGNAEKEPMNIKLAWSRPQIPDETWAIMFQ